jgi:hypothetical protein
MRLILSLPGNETFARHLAEAGGWELGAIETRRFPDGETYVRVLSDVADRPVDLVCTLARPDDGFLRLAFAADAARALGASEVTLVAPYLSYIRQDRRFQPGEAVTSSSFARLVSSNFDRLVTVDPHLHRYPALSALYTIPTETLHAAPLLADWIAAEVEGGRGIGPDHDELRHDPLLGLLSGKLEARRSKANVYRERQALTQVVRCLQASPHSTGWSMPRRKARQSVITRSAMMAGRWPRCSSSSSFRPIDLHRAVSFSILTQP